VLYNPWRLVLNAEECLVTEIWFRNPHNYIAELEEVGHRFVAWDRGILIKRNIDPYKHAKLYFGETVDFRALCIGNQGTMEIDQDHNTEDPVAVYPTWEYGEKMEILEEMMASNIGDDPGACNNLSLSKDQRPVMGQEHRVIITDLPNAQLGASRKFYVELKELQEDYPEAILHIHGSFSFRMMFGMGYCSADYEPRHHAAHKVIMLPNGKAVRTEQGYQKSQQWINLLDMRVPDMKVPRKRCIYNMKSAIWASDNWTQNVKFKSMGKTLVDPAARSAQVPLGSVIYKGKPGPGDMINCDSCSLADTCKYYREGAVCSVPGSEGSTLARYFQSRDSGTIIDALGAVVATQARRIEQGIAVEEEFGDLDPQVSKDLNSIFKNGAALAKLVDPTLSKPKVNINVGAGGTVSGVAPNQVMSSVIRELVSQGVRKEDITPDMIRDTLAQMAGRPKEVEGTVVKSE
jgi:hypothetical protein